MRGEGMSAIIAATMYLHILRSCYVRLQSRGGHPNKHCTHGCNHTDHLLPCHDHTAAPSDHRIIQGDFLAFVVVYGVLHIINILSHYLGRAVQENIRFSASVLALPTVGPILPALNRIFSYTALPLVQ